MAAKTSRRNAGGKASFLVDTAPPSSLTKPKVPDIASPTGAPYPISATPASGADSVNRYTLLNRYNRWRERYNPLRALNVAKAITLMESYQRGEMADPQWTYFFVEQSDPDLFAILERREAALLELDWNIKEISTRWQSDDPRNDDFDEALAAAQKTALREAYEGIDNLYEAISHLQLATFRGYSHCEKYRNADGDVFHLEIVDQWNMVRDLLRGQWKYNPAAIQTTFYNLPAQMLVDPADFIIRERDRHVNRIALLKYIRANLADKDWDAFIEIYGIPSGVVIGPAGVQPGKEAEYEQAAREIAGGGSGYLPNGSDYKPNDQPRGNSPFKVRLDYLSEKLVLAGTGGLLTMLAQSGSGTLAGNAHMEAFQSIARAEAKKISEIFQRQFDAALLDEKFPGQPHLVYFEIAANDELDPGDIAEQAAKLRQAGYRIDTDQLSEKTGYTLTDAPTKKTTENDSTGVGFDEEQSDGEDKPQADDSRLMNRLRRITSAPDTELGEQIALLNREFPSVGAILNAFDPKEARDEHGRWVAEQITRGREAMRISLDEKSDMFGAMKHEELGAIDFRYGKPGDASREYKGGFGISHVAAKHGEEAALKIPEAIARGKVIKGDRTIIQHEGHRVVLAHNFNGVPTNRWVVTAYEKMEKKEGNR